MPLDFKSLVAKDFYKVLGVSIGVEQKALEKAYKKLLLINHPDKNSSDTATEKTKQIVEAFAFLSDPANRRLYDEAYQKNMQSKMDEEAKEAKLALNTVRLDRFPDEADTIFAQGTVFLKTPIFNRQFSENNGLQFINALIFHLLQERHPEALASCWMNDSHITHNGVPFLLNLSEPYGIAKLNLPWIDNEYLEDITATFREYGIFSSVCNSYHAYSVINLPLFRVENSNPARQYFCYDQSKFNLEQVRELRRKPLSFYQNNDNKPTPLLIANSQPTKNPEKLLGNELQGVEVEESRDLVKAKEASSSIVTTAANLNKRNLSTTLLEVLDLERFNAETNNQYYLKWRSNYSEWSDDCARIFCKKKGLSEAEQAKFSCSLEALGVLKKFLSSGSLKDLPHDVDSGSYLWRRGGGPLDVENDYEVCIEIDPIQLAHDLELIKYKQPRLNTEQQTPKALLTQVVPEDSVKLADSAEVVNADLTVNDYGVDAVVLAQSSSKSPEKHSEPQVVNVQAPEIIPKQPTVSHNEQKISANFYLNCMFSFAGATSLSAAIILTIIAAQAINPVAWALGAVASGVVAVGALGYLTYGFFKGGANSGSPGEDPALEPNGLKPSA